MYMNIYITPQNENHLRSLPDGESMSGLINALLTNHFEGLPDKTPAPSKNIGDVDVKDLLHPATFEETKSAVHDWGKNNSEATPRVDTEMACCLSATPCKHWSWSELREGYVNSLSGRFKEAS